MTPNQTNFVHSPINCILIDYSAWANIENMFAKFDITTRKN